MTPDQIRPIRAAFDLKDSILDKNAQGYSPIDLLIRAIEEASDHTRAESGGSPQSEQAIEAWIDNCLGREPMARVSLSSDALDIIAALAPEASLTEDYLERVETKRKAVREDLEAIKTTLNDCEPESPGELIRFLRERVGADVEGAAQTLGISSTLLISIERAQHGLMEISPASLPAFAALVGEPLQRLVSLLRLSVKRLLAKEILARANLALGRFDELNGSAQAKTERLRLAFARMEEENRQYGAFFRRAANQGDEMNPSVRF